MINHKAEEQAYACSSALIAWTEHSGIEFQEIDKVSQIRLSPHCFHLDGILLQTGTFTHGIFYQHNYSSHTASSTAIKNSAVTSFMNAIRLLTQSDNWSTAFPRITKMLISADGTRNARQ